MEYFSRKITESIKHALERGKSVLLLGSRQTGKTTLIQAQLKPDLYYSFIQPAVRLRYERNPSLLASEIEAEIKLRSLKKPLIALDEVQKIPLIMDVVQDLIDRKVARFILTGSAARKLKHGASLNLLPGRIVLLRLDPLLLSEMPTPLPNLHDLLLYGTLPGIVTESSNEDKNIDLDTYVKTYLEEEVRAEALVRNIGHFAKFLLLAASESGNLINLTKLSQEIGIAHTTIAAYYQILEDCLLIEKVQALTKSRTRQRLSKAPKFIFFDLGIRRLCAEEGNQLPLSTYGKLFEQFVGLELIRNARLLKESTRISYWRDHNGPEVDYVVEQAGTYTPIEVKWTDMPSENDCRHLKVFFEEYQDQAKQAYIICQTPKRYFITKNIIALPWQEIAEINLS
jgi:predicted AAA+ superfamily ATPase